jgi:hypothetical protein
MVRRPLGAALIAAGLVLAGCGDPTAPAPTVLVSVVSVRGPFLSDDGTGLLLTCEADLAASATGPVSVTWQDAVFRFYAGADTTTVLDSAIVPASTIRASWGRDSIGPGDNLTSHWTMAAGFPFAVAVEYRFETGGRSGSSRVIIRCGPSAAGHTTPPRITTFSVAGAGPFEPGKPLNLSFAATSETGLWQTTVHVTGACQVTRTFPDSLRLSVTRTLTVNLPRGCQLGVPLAVSVTAEDAEFDQAQQSLPPLTLVDVTPPTIVAMMFPKGGGSGTTTLGGDYFVGDSIQLDVFVSDNHALRAVVWEVLPAGSRDSIAVSDSDQTWSFKLPVRPQWSGDFQLNLFARDASGNGKILASTPTAFHAYPSGPGSATVFRAVPGDITDVVLDARRGVVWLLQAERQQITEVSATTLAIMRTVTIGVYAPSFDITPGGDSLVVTLPLRRALGVVDLRPPVLTLSTLALPLDSSRGEVTGQVRVLSNGKAFVTTGGSALSSYRLFEVDLTTGANRVRLDAGSAGIFTGSMERSFNHAVVITNSGYTQFQRYDVATDVFGPNRTGPANVTAQVNGDGSVIAIGDDLFDGNIQFLRRIQGGSGSIAPTALSEDGTTHFKVVWPDGVIRSGVSDGQTMDVIRNPLQAEMIRISADGHTLVTVEKHPIHGPMRISVITLP